MGDSKAICIVQLMRGHVLAYQENGKPSGAAMEYRGDRDGEQKWILETGNEPSIVALKCVANNKYLRAETKNYGKLSTGEKQWWKVLPAGDEGDMRLLGSCRLHVVDNPEWFLFNCNERGSYIKPGGAQRGDAYMKWWSDSDQRRYTWYFVDPETSANLTPGSANPGTSEVDFEKSKALEDREAALAQKEKDISTKQEILKDHEASLAQKEKDCSIEKKALDDREAALEKQQKDHLANMKACEERKAILEQQETDSAADQKTFDDRKAALAQGEKDLFTDKKALQDCEAALAKKERNHNAEWNKKMEDLQRLQQSTVQLEKSGASSAGSPGCGYKHYKPPRKINRKVIGLVYEE